jgi:ATP-dependent helicase/nuclease subunit A
MAVLIPDKDLKFPEFVLLKASAGSGKTHALSLRFVQFLLSDLVKDATRSDLRNILAITFTKNAAREMKTRILGRLKDCCFADVRNESREIREILEVVAIPGLRLPRKAEDALDRILCNYSDFQVETIDSFMAAIFRASAIDLGYSPDFEIVLDNAELIRYAFFRHLRRVTARSDDGRIFKSIVDHILANAPEKAPFAWDPTPQVLETLRTLHTKLAARDRDLKIENFEDERAGLQKRIARVAGEMKDAIDASGLEPDKRGHCHSRILPAIGERRFADLLSCSFKTAPVKKPKSGQDVEIHGQILRAWANLEALVNQYKSHYARDYFYPYLLAFQALSGTLDQVKRRLGTVFIEDIGKRLSRYINKGIVPDVYFRLGDRVFHYLIDEFQDTSLIQWTDLKPLIEESLSQEGSLFVVGDTKQAIYGFRAADYEIMKNLEEGRDGFPSVPVDRHELHDNHRCHESVLEFVKKIFLGKLNEDGEYRAIAERSGLNRWEQEPVDEHRGSGYVEYVVLEKDPDVVPEKAEIQNRVLELKKRGYAWSDMAVLTYKNESVAEIASWLNEKHVPFIPFSSLDIRKRKIIGEIIALLQFLDSPPDDLSFSVFLLGDVLKKKMDLDGRIPDPAGGPEFLFAAQREKDYPLYSAFRTRHTDPWNRYFEPFFKSVGYYPLYDLVTMIYRVFDVFELFPEEEAALTKLLEVIKDFEGSGRNDLREFLELTTAGEGQGSDWTIDVPPDADAVRIMSIHKAKGLGFQVVIFLVYGEKWMPPDFYIGEDEDFVRIYKINQDLAEADEELAGVYEERRMKDAVERLNRLYVALTRAKVELHIIGVKGNQKTYPFDLLGEENYVSAPAPPAACPQTRREDSPRADAWRVPGPFELPPNRRETLNYENIRRGEIAHGILAGLEFLRSGWDGDIARIVGDMAPRENEAPLFDAVGRSIVRFFQGSPLDELFIEKEGRRVLREVDFCDAAGAVYRMDRVVFDGAAVHIVDFKTGGTAGTAKRTEWKTADREQVGTYVRIMKEIFPGKSVRGILAYIDRNEWETVA